MSEVRDQKSEEIFEPIISESPIVCRALLYRCTCIVKQIATRFGFLQRAHQINGKFLKLSLALDHIQKKDAHASPNSDIKKMI